jgi:hypothetical protein
MKCERCGSACACEPPESGALLPCLTECTFCFVCGIQADAEADEDMTYAERLKDPMSLSKSYKEDQDE